MKIKHEVAALNLLLAFSIGLIGLGSLSVSATQRIGPDVPISFELGESNLSDEAKNKIRELIDEAKTQGELKEVQVAVWSDNNMAMKGKQLSKFDRKLADKRSKTITDFLNHELSLNAVKSYNMSERANWLSRLVKTSDAKLKSEIAKPDDYPMSSEAFEVFREKGEPSRAVLVTVIKDK